MNPWLRGSTLTNPYYRNAFRVARVPREIVRHRTIVQLVGQTRQLVNANSSSHVIGSQPVSNSEINTAEQILLDPVHRVLEELIEHAAERLPLERIRKLAKDASALMEPGPEPPSPVNWKVLDLMGPAIIDAFLAAEPGPGPSFGALELEIPPPYGRHDKE
jgi:hypothetical protein